MTWPEPGHFNCHAVIGYHQMLILFHADYLWLLIFKSQVFQFERYSIQLYRQDKYKASVPPLHCLRI